MPKDGLEVNDIDLGGGHTDEVKAVALNAAGEAFVTGETLSSNFPTTPGAFQSRSTAWSAAFVTRLRPDGSGLIYSTYLAGSTINTMGNSIALGAGDEVFVGGRTYAPDFPTTPGAFRTTYGGGSEAFVSRLNATGSNLIASTFFGGNSSAETGLYINIHSAGWVTLAGMTWSSDMPVTANAFQSSMRGSTSAFFTILNPRLTSMLYGTYYGGSVGEAYLNFSQNAAGHLVIVGGTASPDLPGARGSLQGAGDFFVAVFDPFQLVAARYLNTPDYSSGPFGVHIDPSGVVTFAGSMAAGFPMTTGAWLTVPRHPLGGGFVARMGPSLDLWYASYFGGSVADGPDTMARTRHGWTLLGGRGASPDMPTPGVFNATLRGMNDGFVARMDLLPTGVERYGVSSGACRGTMVMDVTSMPTAGMQEFTVVCSAAPPSATGWLLLGAVPDNPGRPVLGARVHLGLSSTIVALPVSSNALGFGAVRMPLNSVGRGAQAFAQFVWVNPSSCMGNGPLSSSHALAIVVQ